MNKEEVKVVEEMKEENNKERKTHKKNYNKVFGINTIDPENPTIASVSPLSTLNDTSSITLLSSNVFIKFFTSILIVLKFYLY